MKTAVVTGATGFIGARLTELLAESGVHIQVVGRNEKKLAALSALEGVTAVAADFGEYPRLHEGLAAEPDVFYHCAFAGGFGSETLRDYGVQIDNAKYACDAVACAIRLKAKKFVLASTVNTVEIRSFVGNESFAPRYTCVYSTGKLAAELIGKTLAHNSGLAYCTALIAMPYGEGNRARTLPNIVMEQLMAGQRPKLIEGNNLYDLIYIDDVARGLQAIGEKGRDFRDYYVGHRKLDTFRNWMIRIRDVLSPGTELGFGEYPDAPALDYSLVDLDALYNDAGFESKTNFEESIRMTANWLADMEETPMGVILPRTCHPFIMAILLFVIVGQVDAMEVQR